MAELEITNKTLKVTGAPRTDQAWWWRWLKLIFTKPSEVESRKLRRTSYPLSGLQAADLMPHRSDWSFQLLLENGLKSREYWTLLLVMRDYSTKVLSSRDFASMDLAYNQVHAAMNASDDFKAVVNIANSTIVIDSEVDGPVNNNVNPGTPRAGGAATN